MQKVNGYTNWHILTTCGKMPFDVFKRTFETFKYDKLFVWVNNNTEPEVWEYLSTKAEAMVVTPKGSGKCRWIRIVPFELGKLWEEEIPYYVSHFDDDESWPPHPDFNNYLQKWIKSDSDMMSLHPVYFYPDTETISLTKIGVFAYASFFYKYKPELEWWHYKGFGTPQCPMHDPWKCPYPVPHYNKMTKSLRSFYVNQVGKCRKIEDKDRPLKWKINHEGLITRPFNPEWTVGDLYKMYKEVRSGKITK